MTREARSPRTRRAHRRKARPRVALRIGAAIGVGVVLAAVGAASAMSPVSAAPKKNTTPTPTPTSTPPATIGPLGHAVDDTGGLSAITRIIGAQQAWADGWTGRGVDVAVIDTGVARVPGLAGADKVIDGPDLSFDAPDAPEPGLDAHGHGTFMAGLIAGRDDGAGPAVAGCTTCLNSSGFSDTTKYVGVAPEARIVNVKVGAADGAADVTQVIAAIDWVTQHAHDPGMNIKVLSLSFGTDSKHKYQDDPLAQAAEQAWKHGIVVVVAAGNDGSPSGKVADPAFDPYLIAVGADDPLGTLATADDEVPDFAQHGHPTRPVDVIAPATHVVGLRVPGGFVDSLTSNTGRLGTRFQRGSGTSQATALVSGAAALLAQKYPTASPDTIKGLLGRSAHLLPKKPGKDQTAEKYSGNGIADAGAALAAAPAASTQTWAASTGTGSLDNARAGGYVASNGADLRGQQDIFGHPFDAAAMAAAQSQARAWTGGTWNGNRWSGDSWSGNRWSATRWTGTDWAGNRWSGNRWSGMTWDGNRWSGSGWNGNRWSGSGWDGNRWSTADPA